MNQKTIPFSRAVIALLALLAFSGCGPSLHPYASKNLKGGEGVRLAILPFDNLTSASGVSKSLENIMMIEFLKYAPVSVIDRGEVMGALSDERIRLATAIPKASVLSLGEKMGADLLLVGIIHEYGTTSAGGIGGIPTLSMTVRVLDTKTGDVVWAGNATRRGNDREKIFGIGKIYSLNTLAEETAKEFALAFSRSIR